MASQKLYSVPNAFSIDSALQKRRENRERGGWILNVRRDKWLNVRRHQFEVTHKLSSLFLLSEVLLLHNTILHFAKMTLNNSVPNAFSIDSALDNPFGSKERLLEFET